MRVIFLTLILLLTLKCVGQEHNCNTIQFLNKDSLNSASQISPYYNPRGFYLLQNGVYDFIIEGKKYFQSILIKVENEKFYISQNWESYSDHEIVKDTLSFSIDQKIQIRMISINNGVGGIPTRTKFDDFVISIVQNDKFCWLKYVNLKKDDKHYLGHLYFTSIGLRKLKIVNGKPFLVEEKGEYILRRN